MGLRVIDCDILTIERGVIAHQVNAWGWMGSDTGQAIKEKYPLVYKKYCREQSSSKGLYLGDIVPVRAEGNLHVVNMVMLDKDPHTGAHTTDYSALEVCLQKASDYARKHHEELYLPYGLGVNPGGGDWDTVVEIIEKVAPNAIICHKQ